jgi:hypothetical protein
MEARETWRSSAGDAFHSGSAGRKALHPCPLIATQRVSPHAPARRPPMRFESAAFGG